MNCIIPCAGESSRMSYIPKALIKIGDKTILEHIVDAWKDLVDQFIFIIRPTSTYLWEHLPENSTIVFQKEPKGLADAILKAEPCVSGKFIIALGDCLHKGVFENKKFDLGIGVWKSIGEEYKKNYTVQIHNGRVSKVIEKPKTQKGYCGMGTYFLDDRVFNYIRSAQVSPSGGDFTEVIQKMIDSGEVISPIFFDGQYINVGNPEDIKRAERILMRKKIVAISGGFDPLHPGHIAYIKEAQKLGSYLLVILTRDEQLIEKDRMAGNKKNRPPIPYDVRKATLEWGLNGRGEVVENIDKDITSRESLRKYHPDIFAKGGNSWDLNSLPEKEVCDELGIKIVFGVGGYDKPYSSSDLGAGL